MKPGCKVDTMLILEGAQGIGKSSALRTLAGAWFLDHLPNLDNKDAQVALAGCWIVEVAELDAMSRAESSKVKEYLTRQEDQYRPPYGRTTIKVPRQGVFAGTTNGEQYLKDPTGGRRFWPVRCTQAVNVAALQAERDQLWAEAAARYLSGERWWIDSGDKELLDSIADEQESRRQQDPWEPHVEEFLKGKISTTVAEVLAGLGLDKAKQDRSGQMRVAAVLKSLGWRQSRSRKAGLRVYKRVEDSPGDNPAMGDNGGTTSNSEGCHGFSSHNQHLKKGGTTGDNLFGEHDDAREAGGSATSIPNDNMSVQVAGRPPSSPSHQSIEIAREKRANGGCPPVVPEPEVVPLDRRKLDFLAELERALLAGANAIIRRDIMQMPLAMFDQLEGRYRHNLEDTGDAEDALQEALEWANTPGGGDG